MIFKETEVKGVFIVEAEIITDARGFFARSWSPEEFAAQGLNPKIAQCSISFNTERGTLRGMHFQTAPHEEAKFVRCTRGAIYDVAVDLRPDSPTRYRWVALDLSAENRRMVYIPEGFAHGYQTLEDMTEISYQVSESYHPESARGLRWDDPLLNIEWPLPVSSISDRDRQHPLIEASG
jgi:dTDP-4-dehydrorhamnose 3,5-epimerase